MTITTCQKCGVDSALPTCWLCRLENETEYVYFRSDNNGKIILWSTEKGDFDMKLKASDFCELIRLQYPRGN